MRWRLIPKLKTQFLNESTKPRHTTHKASAFVKITADKSYGRPSSLDELCEDMQRLVEQSGTPEQKALFNFQVTSTELSILFKK